MPYHSHCASAALKAGFVAIGIEVTSEGLNKIAGLETSTSNKPIPEEKKVEAILSRR